MANYYVASNSNNAEGPYSFEELAERFDAGEINRETLVCPKAGKSGFLLEVCISIIEKKCY